MAVGSSDKTWSIGEENGKPLQHPFLENPMDSVKRQKDRTHKDQPPAQEVSNKLPQKRGDIAPGGMKRLNQSGDSAQLWICLVVKVKMLKEQYCIGTWNVRSMNQGKLEVVKQEMARVNIYILGIRELKWMGIGKFNSDDHYMYYCEQETLRRNGVAIKVNKRVQNAVLACNFKKQ